MTYMENILNAFEHEFYSVEIPFLHEMTLKFTKDSKDGLSRNNLFLKVEDKRKNLPLSFGPYKSFEFIQKSLDEIDRVEIITEINDPLNKYSVQEQEAIAKHSVENVKSCMKYLYNKGFEFKESLLNELYDELNDDFKSKCDSLLDEIITLNKSNNSRMISLMSEDPIPPIIFRESNSQMGFFEKLKYSIPISIHKYRSETLESFDSTNFVWNVLEKLTTEYYLDLENDSEYLKGKGKIELYEKTKDVAGYYRSLANRITLFNINSNGLFNKLKTIYRRKYDKTVGVEDLNSKIDFIYSRLTDNGFILPQECARINAFDIEKLYK